MPNYNKVMLMGNLTRDVELKHTSRQHGRGQSGACRQPSLPSQR